MELYPHIDVSKLLHCGVYCLLRKQEVVYVGQSKKPLTRLLTHFSNRGKELGKTQWDTYKGPVLNGKGINFDGVWFMPCMLGQLNTIEGALIKHYSPKYNVRGKAEPVMPIPEEIKALLRQMMVITNLPPQQDSIQRFIPRRL